MMIDNTDSIGDSSVLNPMMQSEQDLQTYE